VKFAYNNKIYVATKTSPFKVNYGQNPRIGFEEKRKEKYCYKLHSVISPPILQ